MYKKNGFVLCIAKGLIVSFLICILVSCRASYPTDHEQLSEEERIVIRFSHVVGEETPKGLAARKFAKLVKERTNGRVEVQVFPNGTFYRDGEEIDALLRGDIQMIAPATSKLTDLVPEFSVIDLPFAFENEKEVHSYLTGPIGNELLQKLLAKGVYPLDIWDNGFKQMTNNRGPLVHLEDFMGLKIRIMPSWVLEEQFQTLQATSVHLTFNEVFQQLEMNGIDGQENTLSNITSRNLFTLQSYMTLSNHGYLGYLVLTNNTFWNSLPTDVQQVIKKTLEEVTEWEREVAQSLNHEKLTMIRECNCISVHELSDEERKAWEEAFKPIYQTFSERFGARYISHLPKNKK